MIAFAVGLVIGAVLAESIILPLHVGSGAAFLIGSVCGCAGVLVATGWQVHRGR